MTSNHITHQPMSLSSMDLHYQDEKRPDVLSCTSHNCQCGYIDSRPHRTCHNSRLRRVLMPALISIMTVVTIIFICCVRNFDAMGVFASDGGVWAVSKRAVVDSTGSNNGGSTFTNNKLYLIIIFVGLVLVLILGIMLSAWCCRGTLTSPPSE